MKNLVLITAFMLMAAAGFAQSKSFATLKDHFKGEDNVHAFTVGGWLANLALKFVDDEDINSHAIQKIGSIHLITIPKKHFEEQGLSVNGYKRYIAKDDAFEELLTVKDQGSHVSIFMKQLGEHYNRYLLLVEENEEVTAIEFKGYIDVDELMKNSKREYCQI